MTNFLGLGFSKEIHFSEIDGFKVAILPSEYEDYEYLYIMKNRRKIINLSEFYHKNLKNWKLQYPQKPKILELKNLATGKSLKKYLNDSTSPKKVCRREQSGTELKVKNQLDTSNN